MIKAICASSKTNYIIIYGQITHLLFWRIGVHSHLAFHLHFLLKILLKRHFYI